MLVNTQNKFKSFIERKGFPELVKIPAPLGQGATVIPEYRAEKTDSRAWVLYRGPSSDSSDKSRIGSSDPNIFTTFDIPTDLGISSIDTIRYVVRLQNTSNAVNYLYPTPFWFRNFTIETPGNSSAILIQSDIDNIAKYWSLNEERAKVVLPDGGFVDSDYGGGYEEYDSTGPNALDLYRNHPLISRIKLQPQEIITLEFHLLDTPITIPGLCPCFYPSNRLYLQMNYKNGAEWCSAGDGSVAVIDMRLDFYGTRFSDIEQARVSASVNSELSLTIPYHMNTTMRKPLDPVIANSEQSVVLTDLAGTYTAFNFWLNRTIYRAADTPGVPNYRYFQDIAPELISWGPASAYTKLAGSLGETYSISNFTFQPDGSSTYLGMNLNSSTLAILTRGCYQYHSYLAEFYKSFYTLPFSANVYLDTVLGHVQSSGTLTLASNAKITFVPNSTINTPTSLFVHGYRVAMMTLSKGLLFAAPV